MDTKEEVTLKDYFEVLWKNRLLIAALPICTALITVAFCKIITPVYSVDAFIKPGRVFNIQFKPPLNSGAFYYSLTADRIKVSDTNAIAAVLENVCYPSSVSELEEASAENISGFRVKTLPATDIVKISVETSDGPSGCKLANKILDSLSKHCSRDVEEFHYNIENKKRQLEGLIFSAKMQIKSNQNTIRKLKENSLSGSNRNLYHP
ncbi:MAG: Wzz/FepE/Etk N-terminal domain-containing protein, partial [Candidatus Brocadiales bacterium]